MFIEHRLLPLLSWIPELDGKVLLLKNYKAQRNQAGPELEASSLPVGGIHSARGCCAGNWGGSINSLSQLWAYILQYQSCKEAVFIGAIVAWLEVTNSFMIVIWGPFHRKKIYAWYCKLNQKPIASEIIDTESDVLLDGLIVKLFLNVYVYTLRLVLLSTTSQDHLYAAYKGKCRNLWLDKVLRLSSDSLS